MLYDARENAHVRNAVLLASGVTWILLLVQPGSMRMFNYCPETDFKTMPLTGALQMLLAMTQTGFLAAGWVLMLIAMMSPVLIAPIRHILLRTFKRRRARSIVIFLVGYAAIWITLGGVLLTIELAIDLFAPKSYLPAVAAFTFASVWQCSPIKQRCLNRCHSHIELAAFGASADCDALRFGATFATWCAGSCWAMMLFPMLLARGHVLAMAAVAVLIFAERLDNPKPPCWRWRGMEKAIRIVIAQARILLHRRPIRSCSLLY